MRTQNIIVEIISFLLIFLFVYAAISKLLDLDQFTIQASQSPILEPISGFVVWAVPAVEIVIALMLAVRRFRLMGMYASFAIMFMFTAYIVAILKFSDEIPCSCGGVLELLGWTEHIFFNSFFIVASLIGVFLLTVKRDDSVSLSLK